MIYSWKQQQQNISCIIHEYFKVRSNVLFIMKIDKKNFMNSQRCFKGLSIEFIEIFPKTQFFNSIYKIVDFMFFLFIFFWFHQIEHVVIKNRHVICKERKILWKNLKQKTKIVVRKSFQELIWLISWKGASMR